MWTIGDKQKLNQDKMEVRRVMDSRIGIQLVLNRILTFPF